MAMIISIHRDNLLTNVVRETLGEIASCVTVEKRRHTATYEENDRDCDLVIARSSRVAGIVAIRIEDGAQAQVAAGIDLYRDAAMMAARALLAIN